MTMADEHDDFLKYTTGDPGRMTAAADQSLAEALDTLREHGLNGFILHVHTHDSDEGVHVKTIAHLVNAGNPNVIGVWAQALNTYAIRLAEHANNIIDARLWHLLFGDEEDDNADV
jgi:hypothetical protein